MSDVADVPPDRAEPETDLGIDLKRAHFEALLDALPIGATIKDRAGRFVYVNRQSAALWGYGSKDVLEGRTAAELMDAEVAAYLAERDRRVLESRTALPIEEIVAVIGGERRTFIGSKAPLIGRDG